MLDDDDEGVPRPRQRNVVTDGTLLRRQELPRAAQLVATDDYFFLIVAEIYSPSKFYWFLKDQRRAIETVGVAVWLCTRAGATPISFFFPPFFVSGLSKLLRTIRRPASAVVVAVVGCVDVVLSSMVRFFLALATQLSDDMTEFYTINSEYALARHDLYLGQVLAVEYVDRVWYRGRIAGFPGDQKVTPFFCFVFFFISLFLFFWLCSFFFVPTLRIRFSASP